MDKVTIGIPRGIPYYYYGNFWKIFFKQCGIKIIESPKTNEEIIKLGSQIAPDEMCLSMKIYLGHMKYLEDKCDYLFVPRIDRFDNYNQTCTNFLAFYDLANHYCKIPILHYNIDSNHTVFDGALEIGNKLEIPKMKLLSAYGEAQALDDDLKKKRAEEQQKILESPDKKILIVSHSYNIHDEFIGSAILKFLNQYPIKILYSDYFLEEDTNSLSKQISQNLYWKYSKESIGAIPLCQNVDGIIFLSTFPCGLDSLVHELAIRKIQKPYLNLVIDDISSMTGIETRIESFVDLIEQN